MDGAVLLGVIGLTLALLNALLVINNKDGSGWGLLAFFFLLSSCAKV